MRGPLLEAAEITGAETLGLLRRAARYIGPFRGRFAIKLGLGAVSLIPLLLLPWPVKLLVDQVIEGHPIGSTPTPLPFFVRPLFEALEGAGRWEMIGAAIGFQALLLLLVGAIGTSGREQDQTSAYLSGGHDTATNTENEANAGFSMAGGLFGYIDFHWTLRLTQALNHYYRSQLFERIQSLPMSVFDDERIGDAVYRVMYDTPSITNGVYRILLTPILATAMIIVTVAVLHLVFGAHPRIVWTGLAMLPVSLLGTLPFAARLRRRGESSRVAGATTTATVEEGIANIVAVQSLGGGEREQHRFGRDSWDSFSEFRSIVRLALLAFIVTAVPAVFLVVQAFLYAVDLVIAGAISRGDFFLFMGYFGIIAGASVEIGALWFRVQTSAAGLHRVFFLMDLPGETDAPDARSIGGVERGASFENVSFAYPDGTEAIRGVDLELPVGEVSALVGPAGAGKTTLAYLLCGYLRPTGGCVRLDGVDLSEITHDSLRSQISFVFQETALFDDTAEANLRLGRPDAPEAVIHRAARMAGADDFLRTLPQGYATPLGRGGGKLSVGQKQRLAIARALVRETPVLVLDEPTSALDPETERRIVQTLREAARDRLVLVIAHRLSTIRAADQICFVDDGCILERGTHEELMARPDGAYRRYWELQTSDAA